MCALRLCSHAVLYFIDESGIDLKDAPCLVLAGVAVREPNLWPFAQAFLKLKADILRFSPDRAYDAKGNKLLTRRVFQQAGLDLPLGADVRGIAVERLHTKNGRGENAGFHELLALAQAKIAFVEAALDLAEQFDMRVFASIVARDAPQQRDRSILRKDFSYLFERLHSHTCDEPDAQGILILDEQDKALSQRLLDQMHRYFVETRRGRQRAERLIPQPFFVHSDLTPAVQLADLVAYIANWGLRTERMTEPARAELRPLADRVFSLRYRHRRHRSPMSHLIGGERAKSGIVYIDDLRPRDEREPEDVDEDEDVEEVQASA